MLVTASAIFTAKAQLGYNYAQFSLGAGVSYMSSSTNVPNPYSNVVPNINFGYNITPYANVSLDFQFGRLGGGYSTYYNNSIATLNTSDPNYATLYKSLLTSYIKTTNPNQLNFTNNFQALTLRADVQMGELFDMSERTFWNKTLRNVYVGSGIGLVFNHITDNNGRMNADSTYSWGGYDNSENFLIPIRVGYQFKMYNNYDEPSVVFEVGYQYNMVLGYGFDGYADPLLTTKSYEAYSGISFGIKFNFGNVTSYRRSVH